MTNIPNKVFQYYLNTSIMILEDLKKWFAELLDKIFGMFEGKENLTIEEENSLLESVADDVADEQQKKDVKDAISQLCEEIDLTNHHIEDMSKAVDLEGVKTLTNSEREGKEKIIDEVFTNGMLEDARELNDSLSATDINENIAEDVESMAEQVSKEMNEE